MTMNYVDLTNAALSAADRTDSACLSQMDNFFRYVEARINRYLIDQNMAISTTIPLVTGTLEYTLPDGFLSARSIKVIPDSDLTFGGYPVATVNIEQLTNIIANSVTTANDFYCSIIKNTIKLNAASTGNSLYLEYYGTVPPLSESQLENWVSKNHPDCYVFGLLVEIYSWVKNSEAAQLWDVRFKEVLNEIITQDVRKTIGNNPLQIRLG